MENISSSPSPSDSTLTTLQKHGVSQKTIHAFQQILGEEQLLSLPLSEFASSQEIFNSEFDKPKYKLSVPDKVGLAWLRTIVAERVEEREIYQ